MTASRVISALSVMLALTLCGCVVETADQEEVTADVGLQLDEDTGDDGSGEETSIDTIGEVPGGVGPGDERAMGVVNAEPDPEPWEEAEQANGGNKDN